MKRQSFSFTAIALSTVFAVSSIIPAQAMPLPVPQQPSHVSSDVISVKDVVRKKRVVRKKSVSRKNHRVTHKRTVVRSKSVHRSSPRRDYRRDYHRSAGYHYYRGHRGYSYYRPGYRQYNGWWYPAAAFTAGVAIGTVVSTPVYRGGNAHVRWCRNQYISYRVSDNTFQPYNGPRRQCISPY